MCIGELGMSYWYMLCLGYNIASVNTMIGMRMMHGMFRVS